MARRKKSSIKKTIKSEHEMIDRKTEDLLPEIPFATKPAGTHVYRNRWTYFILLVLAVVFVYLGTKGYIVAAMVNGKPIFGWDVERAMMARYGTQMLDALVSEHLVADAAQKSGITVDQTEVDKKISELITTLGENVKLEDLLAYQGVSKQDFEKQVRLQMMIEKLLGKDVTISEGDIDEYLLTNRDAMVATEEAALREEAKQALLSQAISGKIQTWFADLKTKANIVRILK